MFLRTLPQTLRTEVYRRPELQRLELMKLIDWVRHQTVLERSEQLASQLLKPEKVMSLRSERQRIAKQALVQEPPAAAPPTGAPQIDAVQPPPRPTGDRRQRRPQQGRRQPRTPDPLVREFKGCFHC